uniref:Uncharacterized protein n=1 Tax=Octopus bimaculoides TaxID=37653 RepID=A0A0L8HVR0_OCTBM
MARVRFSSTPISNPGINSEFDIEIVVRFIQQMFCTCKMELKFRLWIINVPLVRRTAISFMANIQEIFGA